MGAGLSYQIASDPPFVPLLQVERVEATDGA